MHIQIAVKDINALALTDVTAIMSRLSWPDSGSSSSIQKELAKRYLSEASENHPPMAMALVWVDGTLAGWVGTRPWPEKFKGDAVIAQTIECFVDPEYRRRGLAKLGVLTLIAAGSIDRDKIVSVYAPEAVRLAEQCGCKIVVYCATEEK